MENNIVRGSNGFVCSPKIKYIFLVILVLISIFPISLKQLFLNEANACYTISNYNQESKSFSGYIARRTKDNIYNEKNININNIIMYIIQNTPHSEVQFLKVFNYLKLKHFNLDILIDDITEYICFYISSANDICKLVYNFSPHNAYMKMQDLTPDERKRIYDYHIADASILSPLKNVVDVYNDILNLFEKGYILATANNISDICLNEVIAFKEDYFRQLIVFDAILFDHIPKDNNVADTKDIYNQFLESNWAIYFPTVDEKYDIYEGVSPEVLNKGIGHFSESKKLSGNIALAGHNRGYDVNSFSCLKDIIVGDTIYYNCGKEIFEYIVCEKEIISEYDYSKVIRTDDFLTLITCVENRPDVRLCVSAKPK